MTARIIDHRPRATGSARRRNPPGARRFAGGDAFDNPAAAALRFLASRERSAMSEQTAARLTSHARSGG